MTIWRTTLKRNISFTATVPQRVHIAPQQREENVLTVLYMFPGVYSSTERVNKRASRVNLKKGDVVLWNSMGHTNIYAGKNSSGERLWYDAGKSATYGHHSGSRFANIGKKTQGYLNSKKISYIIRIKGL